MQIKGKYANEAQISAFGIFIWPTSKSTETEITNYQIFIREM